MRRQLYLDQDGVLADFDNAFIECFGVDPRSYEEQHGTERFKNIVKETPGFFRNLRLMPGARELVAAVAHHRPIVLTAASWGMWVVEQKLEWMSEMFPGIVMQPCASREKRLYCQPGDALVDDYEKYSHLWRDAGGVFILHTSVETSLTALRDHGWIV